MSPITPTSQQLSGGRLNSAIANAVVRLHSHYVGRGPTTVQAFYRHDVLVLVMRGSMTKSERTLVAEGRRDAARQMRRELAMAMRPSLIAEVEGLTGCHVLAFMSDNEIDADVGTEVFVLDRSLPGGHAIPSADRPGNPEAG